MQIDILWLRKWFDTFNRYYFDSSLPTPRFHIGHSHTRLGSLSFKQKFILGKSKIFDFALGMSNYYDQTERQFQSVLLHEMIHLSIAVSGVKDTSPHGVVFRGMMSRLNREGWDIHVTTSTTGLRKAYMSSPKVIKQYLVLGVELADGRCFLSSVSPKYAKSIKDKLQYATSIKRATWYTTSDDWFASMPKVRSLRGRCVSAETFAKKISIMKRIDF